MSDGSLPRPRQGWRRGSQGASRQASEMCGLIIVFDCGTMGCNGSTVQTTATVHSFFVFGFSITSPYSPSSLCVCLSNLGRLILSDSINANTHARARKHTHSTQHTHTRARAHTHTHTHHTLIHTVHNTHTRSARTRARTHIHTSHADILTLALTSASKQNTNIDSDPGPQIHTITLKPVKQ